MGESSGVRPSAIRQRVLAGELVAGAMIFEFSHPACRRCSRRPAASSRCSTLEHAGLGFETCKMRLPAAAGIGIEPLVRVPRSEYTSWHARSMSAPSV